MYQAIKAILQYSSTLEAVETTACIIMAGRYHTKQQAVSVDAKSRKRSSGLSSVWGMVAWLQLGKLQSSFGLETGYLALVRRMVVQLKSGDWPISFQLENCRVASVWRMTVQLQFGESLLSFGLANGLLASFWLLVVFGLENSHLPLVLLRLVVQIWCLKEGFGWLNAWIRTAVVEISEWLGMKVIYQPL